MTAAEDPYVVQRGVFHRLATQVIHENNNRHDLIAVQNNFAQFEHHVIEVIQSALESFNQFVGGQAQKEQQLYADILGTAQCIPFDFEWTQFVQRSGNMLVDPNGSERTIDGLAFPNHDHRSTKPLIEGTLERKSRNKLSMSGYSTGYYVVTPSKFLHEFKDNEYLKKDPVPELSIYLPDATIGTTSGEKFNVKGKDISKGIGSKLSGSSEIQFKAHTASDAQKWSEVIRTAAAAGPSGAYSGSTPTSPISPDEKRVNSFPPQYSAGSSPTTTAGPAPIQTTGIIGGETVTSPVAATPTSAAPASGKEKM